MNGFTYPDQFTHLSTFVMELAQRCLDCGVPTEMGMCAIFVIKTVFCSCQVYHFYINDYEGCSGENCVYR